MAHAVNGPLHVETAVVGAGPAGLLCALDLASKGRSVALIERGGRIADSLCPKVAAGMKAHKGNLRKAERFRDQCPRCDCLFGVGGAAMHFDSNLGYVRELSRPKIEAAADGSVLRFNVLERLFGSLDKAQGLITDGYHTLAKFGLRLPQAAEKSEAGHLVNPEIFAHTDTADSLPAPLALTLPLVGAIETAIEDYGGQLVLNSRVAEIAASSGAGGPARARWTLSLVEDSGAVRTVTASNVVLAVGKSAMSWVIGLVEKLQLEHRPPPTVDIGVRLETKRADMEWMTRACHYPKMTFLSPRKDAVRTFCVCAGGRMMQYEFAGQIVLDGQHCIDEPTDRTNFGILTTVQMPPGVDGTAYALGVAKLVNQFGHHGPLVQTVGDFLAGKPTTSLAGSPLRSSLVNPALGNLHACLPGFLIEDIKSMIERLNAMAPGAVGPYALLAAPVVERAFPSLQLSTELESSRPGLYFAGDCSGKIIGITYAMATGLCVAQAIRQTQRAVAI